MTIITGSEFRANQGKYIQRAQEGERVVVSSKGLYVELKPVSKKDVEVKRHDKSSSYLAVARKVRREYKEGNYVTCTTPEEIEAHLDSL